jgi:hypothetical protein
MGCGRAATAAYAASDNVSALMIGRPLSRISLRPASTLVPDKRTTTGIFDTDVLVGLYHTIRDPVAAVDPGKDVHEDHPDIRVREHGTKRLTYPFRTGTAPDIKKVRRLPPGKLDHIHRRHRKARPVDDAPDIAIQPHIGQPVIGGKALARVFLAGIAQRWRCSARLNNALVSKDIFRIQRHQRVSLQTTRGLISTIMASRSR